MLKHAPVCRERLDQGRCFKMGPMGCNQLRESICPAHCFVYLINEHFPRHMISGSKCFMFINMSNSPFHPMGLILLSVPLYRQGNSDHKGLNDLPQVSCSGQRQDLNPDVLAVELSSKHYTLVSNCYCNNYNFWKVLNHFSHVQFFATLDCSPPCSSVHGFLQARILECVAMPSSRGSCRPRD